LRIVRCSIERSIGIVSLIYLQNLSRFAGEVKQYTSPATRERACPRALDPGVETRSGEGEGEGEGDRAGT
jgi:hypothetical protein